MCLQRRSCPDAKRALPSLQEATGAFKEMARRALQEAPSFPARCPMPREVLQQYLLTQASSVRVPDSPHATLQQRHLLSISFWWLKLL